MIQAMFLRFLYFVLLVSCIIAAWQLMISWQKVKNDWMLRLPYCMSITPNKSTQPMPADNAFTVADFGTRRRFSKSLAISCGQIAS